MNAKLLRAAITIARAYLLEKKAALPKKVLEDLAAGLTEEGVPWDGSDGLRAAYDKVLDVADVDIYSVLIGRQNEQGFAAKTIIGPARDPMEALYMASRIMLHEMTEEERLDLKNNKDTVIPIAAFKGHQDNLFERDDVRKELDEMMAQAKENANNNVQGTGTA